MGRVLLTLKKHRATAGIISTVTLISLILFAAVAVDISWMVAVARELQIVSDNSALAGARRVRNRINVAKQLAVDIAAENDAAGEFMLLDYNSSNALDGDVVVGRFDLGGDLFTPSVLDPPDPSNGFIYASPWPNAVMVNAGREEGTSIQGAVPLILGPAVGKNDADLERSAVAMISGSTGDAIIALCEDCQCSFRNNGTPLLDLGDAALQVNSTHPRAACGIGGGMTVAGEINSVGGIDSTGNKELFLADLNPGSPALPDPLEDLPVPGWDTANDLSCTYDPNANLEPGYYGKGITHTSGHAVLNPGVYVLDGAPSIELPVTIEFDNVGPEAGITVPGTTDFQYQSSNWTGGIVATYSPAMAATTTGPYVYAVTGGAGVVTFDNPARTLDFFYVHDGVNVLPGVATVTDICGNVVTTVASSLATTPGDPLNFVTITATGLPIERIDISGGAIDSFTYDFNKGGLHIGGNSIMDAIGVMFYIKGGPVDMQGNADIDLIPPQEGTYEGVSIFQARDNSYPSKINGTPMTNIQGKLYFKVAELSIGGTPLAFGNQIIAHTIKLNGTSDMYINYVPGPDESDLRVVLVR